MQTLRRGARENKQIRLSKVTSPSSARFFHGVLTAFSDCLGVLIRGRVNVKRMGGEVWRLSVRNDSVVVKTVKDGDVMTLVTAITGGRGRMEWQNA